MKQRDRGYMLVMALGTLTPVSAIAQGPQAEPPIAAPGSDISGRDFAGLKFRVAPMGAPLEFTAQQAITWTEEAPAGATAGTTIGAPVQRMLLQGDVRIRLGINRFGAARAVVWLEPLEPSKVRPGSSVWQVAIYFDRLGEPSADSGTQQSGDRLLVTGVIDSDPGVSADILLTQRPSDPLVSEGERRLARYLDAVVNPGGAGLDLGGTPRGTSAVPSVEGIVVPGMSQPYEPNSPLAKVVREGEPRGSLMDTAQVTEDRRPALFSGRGIVTIAAGEPVLTNDGDERVLIVTGGAVLQYSDPRAGRALQLSAQRAVVFLDPGPLENLAKAPAEKVRGIYLEGDVLASDGRFNQRANQVYYDVKNNRATLIDGVFWTYDDRRGLPLYVRAKTIRQTAANEVSAEDVRIAASSFFEPQLSLGAKDVTITREPPVEGRPARTVIAGGDLTVRTGGLAFFYWPSYTGDLERFPLRDVRAENSSASGFGLKTRWDLFGILGIDPKEDVRLDLLLDGWVKRGAAVGFDSDWRTKTLDGRALGYIVPDDRGTDQLSTGAKRDRSGEVRGMIAIENRWEITRTWSLFAEGTYISDENFVDAYYTTDAETRREFVNSLALQNIDGQASFLAEVRHNFNDFTANQYLLESQGYTVSKLPEIRYTRVGDDLFSSFTPGLVTYNSDYRLSRMTTQFVSPSAFELGFDTNAAAQAALGLNTNQSPESALLTRGYLDRNVLRGDTRQEVTVNLKYGPINVQPFLVGRVTAWDKKFDTFSPRNDDRLRLWGAAGARASTTMQRIYDGVENKALDLYRLRHIVTPSVTVWSAGANRGQGELPVYDQRVEALNEGSTVRAGVEQIFQTQRGGTGRYRSVDVLKINTDIIWSSNDADRRSPFGRFFDDRPEYSALGKYAVVDGAYQLTDALAITGSSIYDLDLNQQARSNIGATLEAAKDLNTYIELRYLNPLNATYLAGGADVRLTSTYTLGAAATFDTNQGRVQTLSVRLSRELPAIIISAKIGYNDITQETTIGFALTPVGKDKRAENLVRRIGREQIDKDLRGPGDEPTRVTLPGE